MAGFLQDLRFAARRLMHSPGYALVTVLTLALGIGAATAIYTVVERVVLDPLAYPDSERLVRLKSAVPGVEPGAEWQLSPGQYFFLIEEASTLDEYGAYSRGAVNLIGPEGPARARVARASAGMLRLVGARPALGRMIDPQDDVPGGAAVAVLSHGFWQRQFGGDRDVIGRTVTVNDQQVEIIGVMERGVELPSEPGAPSVLMSSELWLPLRVDPNGYFCNCHAQFNTIARLAPGASIEEARAELARLNARLPEAVPTAYSEAFMDQYGFETVAHPLKPYVIGDMSRHLWIIFGAVGLVLLIACANVANLFLVRIEGRRREVAIRTALGASRAALARHFFAESLAVALAGGAIALLLAYWGVDWLSSLAPNTLPRMGDLSPDGSVLAFTLGLSLVTAVGLALIPIVRYGRPARAGELAEGGRSSTVGRERQRARAGLIVTQVALALVLVVGAGLLMESFQRLRSVDPGVQPEGVLKMELYLPAYRYQTHLEAWQFYDAAIQRVEALPGVSSAAVSTALPFTGGFGCTVQGFEDPEVRQRVEQAGQTLCASQAPTSPGYFEALGIPLLRGRFFTAADNDNPSAGAVVVSRAFAERFWPGEEPIGKGVGPNGNTARPFYRVVGVVGDVYANSVDEDPAVAIYYPIVRNPDAAGSWSPPRFVNLVVRTETARPRALLAGIQRAIRTVDPSIPVADPEEMQTIVDRSMARLSFTMILLGIAATVALALAAIGLYGVVSYVVTRRTGEIGVRMALGARPQQVERLVLGGSLRLVAAGLVVGSLAALALTRILRGLLYDLEPTHPTAYLAAAAVLGAVAVLASWLPARRAARVDPMVALRTE